MWLPEEMWHIWLATGSQSFGSYRLVLGRNNDGLTIMDMEDYVKALPTGVWRKGGIWYANAQINTLVSASGMTVRGLTSKSPCLRVFIADCQLITSQEHCIQHPIHGSRQA